MTSIFSSLFGIALAVSVGTATSPTDSTAWIPAVGDRLVVDTQENVGYLMRENGEHTAFPVLTGQRRVVHYIGRTYNAATPVRSWTVQSKDMKGRSMTFGETGLFLRLYDEDGQTPYGIHSHLTFQKMLDEGNRYRSMGCILVSEDILRQINQTFELNGGHLDVATVYGLPVPTAPTETLAEKPSWLGF